MIKDKMREYLEFEKPLQEIEERLKKLTKSKSQKGSVQRFIRILSARHAQLEQDIFGNLTPWQRAQIARHLQRPSSTDYIEKFCQDFIELHGDRTFGDDRAIVGGLATFQNRTVCVIGQEKGKGLKDRLRRNFGMANPEGYRKAHRLMKLAEKFRRPILTFIDTPGAYPGVGAEERGQSEAIARNLFTMSRLRIPIIAVIIGEGGSGGALALAVADRVLMLEQAIYSVISPEGCAAILWDDAGKAPEAATALRMTSQELLKFGIIDGIVTEPVGGAHRNVDIVVQNLMEALETHLTQLEKIPIEKLISARYDKFRRMTALGPPVGTPE